MNIDELVSSVRVAIGVDPDELNRDWPEPESTKLKDAVMWGDVIEIHWQNDYNEFEPVIDIGYVFGLPEFATDDPCMAGCVHVPCPSGGDICEPEWTTLWALEHNPRVEALKIVKRVIECGDPLTWTKEKKP